MGTALRAKFESFSRLRAMKILKVEKMMKCWVANQEARPKI